MRLLLLAVGQRQPDWVNTAFAEYAKRLPAHCKLVLHEITAGNRKQTPDIERIKREESERLLKAIPATAVVIALDEHGRSLNTRELSNHFNDWLQDGRDVAMLVGGADGLDQSCLDRADWHWSLSALTLPHGLARIMVAEQLYRAWSLLEGHPYHRE
ncbi:MAG: 23S rRNA (pseudouridine(1915)-N(3))-methyltransferase RlmH [Gammaproteobacteria bacterium]